MIVGHDKLVSFLAKPQQITIPIYQRKYSWEEKQWEQLFEDIKKIGNNSKESHFMGSLVYISYVTTISTIVIIDGQQRITTLSLLISALGNLLIENPEFNELIEYNAEDIVNDHLFNVGKKGEMRYKLLLTDDDNTVYKKIIDNILAEDEFILTDDDKKNQIYKAHEYFINKINKENIESIWEGIKKLQIVFLNLEEGKGDSPQEIFESLNSTGKELNSTDLIRNYILMDLRPEEQKHIYDTYWRPIEKLFEHNSEKFEDFIKNYLTIKKDNWVSNDVYYEFKKFKGDQKIETLVKDVYKYWEIFKKIVFYEEKNQKLNLSFKSINQLPYKIIRPFLMKLYEEYEKGELKLENFIEIIDYTESYLLRRTICDRDSQSIKGFFDRMYGRFKDNDLKPNEYLDYYKSILSSRTGKTSMPDDDEFEKNFLNIDLFNKKRVNKYVLVKLTNYKTKDEIDFKSKVTIEHILPQNPNLSEEWKKELGPNWVEIQTNYLHVVGNLTLTSANSELGDKPFMKKRTMNLGYDKSNYTINNYFKENDIKHWNKDEITKRGKHLFEKAKEIWKLPENFKTNTEYESEEQDSSEKPNLKYWTMCKEQIDNSSIFTSNRKPQEGSSFYLPIKNKSAHIELKINSISKEVKTQLIIKNKKLFEYLENQKTQIKSEINHDLKWESLETKKSATITVTSDEFDLDDDLEWEKSIKWQIDVAEEFYKVFHDRILEFKNIQDIEK